MKKILLSIGFFCAFQSLYTQVPSPQHLPGYSNFKFDGITQWENASINNANVYFRPGYKSTGEKLLNKPIVFVEGIDFVRNPNHTGNGTRLGSFGWNEFWGQNEEEYPMLTQSPLLLNELYARGYDVILIDFHRGFDFMQKNAVLVADILQEIGSQNPDYPTKIVGTSMGGQIAKFALSYMEKNNMKHCVTEYISFDSPHAGANIPISIQRGIDILARLGKENATLKRNEILDSPATQQLLYYHYNPNAATHKNKWNTDVNNLGFPENTRNVAITNGAINGQKQNFQPNDLIFNFDADAMSVGNQQVVHRWMSLYAAGDGLNVNSLIHHEDQPMQPDHILLNFSGQYYLDHVSGGNRNSSMDLYEGFAADGYEAECSNYNKAHAFVPTSSALGLPMTYASNDLSNVQNQIPFDDYYGPTVNEEHAEITLGNIEWILNELEKTEYQFDQSLTGNEINVFRPEQRFLKSTLVGNNSALYINGDISDYTGSTPVIGSHAKALTCDCETEIEVRTGGVFQLGDVNGNSAEFRFTNGSILKINSGAKLILHPNSKLIFESGAKMILEPGAIVENYDSEILIKSGATYDQSDNVTLLLEGNTSNLNIEGNFQLKDNATFKPTYETTHGYVTFNSSMENISFGNNTKVIFEGKGQGVLFLKVLQDELVFNEDVEIFNVTKSKLLLGSNVRIELNAELVKMLVFEVTSVFKFDFFKIRTSNFILQEGLISNGKNGLSIENESLLYRNITTLDVSNCDVGFLLRKGKVNLGTSVFSSNLIGLIVEREHSILQLASINITESFDIGISAEQGASLFLKNCSISMSNIAVSSESSRLFLGCNSINNNEIGIMLSNNSALEMRTTLGYGKNDLSNNTLCIKTYDSRINIFKGFNNLSNTGNTYPVISGTVRYSGGISVNSSYNQWRSGTSFFSNSYVNVRSSFNNSTVFLKDYDPRRFSGCTANAERIEDGEFTNAISEISPNPSSGQISLRSNNKGRFYLYSVDGKEIDSGDFNSYNIVNLNLAKGIYLCRLVYEDNLIETKRVIIQ